MAEKNKWNKTRGARRDWPKEQRKKMDYNVTCESNYRRL